MSNCIVDVTEQMICRRDKLSETRDSLSPMSSPISDFSSQVIVSKNLLSEFFFFNIVQVKYIDKHLRTSTSAPSKKQK